MRYLGTTKPMCVKHPGVPPPRVRTVSEGTGLRTASLRTTPHGSRMKLVRAVEMLDHHIQFSELSIKSWLSGTVRLGTRAFSQSCQRSPSVIRARVTGRVATEPTDGVSLETGGNLTPSPLKSLVRKMRYVRMQIGEKI